MQKELILQRGWYLDDEIIFEINWLLVSSLKFWNNHHTWRVDDHASEEFILQLFVSHILNALLCRKPLAGFVRLIHHTVSL